MLACVSGHKSSGFVLVTALLYLAIITLLVSYALNSSLLQIKISANTVNQNWAFQNAESALFAGENAVQNSMSQGQAEPGLGMSYEFIKLAQQECGANYYEVDGLGCQGKLQVKLQSLLLVPKENQEDCNVKYSTKKRLAWVQID